MPIITDKQIAEASTPGGARTLKNLQSQQRAAKSAVRFGCGCERYDEALYSTGCREAGDIAHRPSGPTTDISSSARSQRRAAAAHPELASGRPKVEMRSATRGRDVPRWAALPLIEAQNARIRAQGDQRTLADDAKLRHNEQYAAELRQRRNEEDSRLVAEARGKLESRRRAELTGVGVDVAKASAVELRDGALRVLEERSSRMVPEHAERIDALLRSSDPATHGVHVARRLLLTENKHYRRAFDKAMNVGRPKAERFAMSSEETAAVNEFRALAIGTGTGGLGVPVTIDPSLTLSAQASDAPIVRLGTTKVIQGSTYKGVSTPGAGWAIKTEGSPPGSDSNPSLAQSISVTVSMASSWIPYSLEVGQDYPNFADEMAPIISTGYLDLLASQSMTGSSPAGLFTQLQGVTTNPSHITVTTLGQVGAVDVRKAWDSMPQRFRTRAVWVMSPTVEAQVKNFDGSGSQVDYQTKLTDQGTTVVALMGRPVIVSDYAPSFTGTTGAENFLAVGDPTTWTTVVGGGGMTIEAVDTVFDASTGRPSGTRGYLAWSQFGFGISAVNGWRLVSNT